MKTAGASSTGSDRGAPRLLTGARLYDPVRDSEPRPGSLLLDGERIRARLEPADAVPEGVRTVALPDGVLMPGFCDAHCHLIWVGLLAVRPDLSGSTGASQCLDRIRVALEDPDGAESILAEGWDETHWPATDRALDRAALDRISPDRPLVARRVCTHRAVGNTAALTLLADLPGADPATGELLEDAAMLVGFRLPGLSRQRDEAVRGAIREAHRHGVTTVHEFLTELSDLERYASLARSGELRLRLRCFAKPDQWRRADPRTRTPDGIDGDRLSLVGMKLFADGSFGARTAAVGEPYRDGGIGALLHTDEGLAAAVRGARDAGHRVAVHAIGDRAVGQVARTLAREGGDGDRIEHVELASPEVIETMARAGITASMQPNFIHRWGRAGGLYDTALGRDRAVASNAFGAMSRAGVGMAFGSDAMPLGPLRGIEGATDHPAGEMRIGWREALEITVAGGPRSLGEPVPSLLDGAPADLVLVEPPDRDRRPIGSHVLCTWFAGDRVYDVTP